MDKKHIKKHLKNSLSIWDEATGWPGWNNQQGSAVQQFIKSALEDSIADIEYDLSSQTLTCRNSANLILGTQVISTAPPSYKSSIEFKALKINATTYNNGQTIGLEVNKSDELKVWAIINYSLFANILGKDFEDFTDSTMTFSFCDSTGADDTRYNPIAYDGISPNQDVEIDITNMFRSSIKEERYLKVIGSTNGKSTNKTAIFSIPLIVRNIILDYTGTSFITGADNSIPNITIDGFTGISEIKKENFYVVIDEKVISQSNYSVSGVASGELIEVTLSVTDPTIKEGAHDLFLRVKSDNNLYSNWKLINYIWQKAENSELTEGTIQITNIPETLYNCNLGNFFSIQTTNRLSSTSPIKIAVLKDTQAYNIRNINTIEEALDSPYLFKYIELNLNSEDEKKSTNYTSYIEIPGEGTLNQVMKFLIQDFNGTRVQRFYSGNTGFYLQTNTFKEITIISNKNSSELQYVPGAILNFSQITNGNVFTNLNSDMDVSDGFQLEKISEAGDTVTTFKVSPISKLFNTAKPLLNSAGENLFNRAFSFELMFKTTNVNDLEDPILTFGNIVLCPKHLFVKVDSEAAEELITPYKPILAKNASRADFRTGEIQHILITYDPEYVPSTYGKVYEYLFPGYETYAAKYPCLKIYVNGSINRVYSINPQTLGASNNYLQIAPSNSNINIYILRTYGSALNYEEVLKNYLSSLFYYDDKVAEQQINDIVYKSSDYTVDVQPSKRDLFGTISLGKCLNNFKGLQEKVYEDRNVMLLVLPYGVKPPHYGNRKDTMKGTLLISYNKTIDSLRRYSGSLYSEKIKAQGTSAKKYTIHNVAESNIKFRNEKDTTTPFDELPDYIELPGSDIQVKKFVGKVNTASCMQSHKQGACKLFHDAYVADPTTDKGWMNGGRKAVLENEFLYFYTNLKENESEDVLKDLTWDYFKKDDGTYDFEDCYFLGFQTWGSAKGDEPTSGYDSTTPEYLMLEGADNANPAANFKTPWAAMQIWAADNQGAEVTNLGTKVFHQFKGKDSSNNPEYLSGLVIQDETILYDPGLEQENSIDKRAEAWDVDFGCEKAPGYDKDKNPLYKFTKNAEHSVNRFAEFYNATYLFDFASLKILENNNITVASNDYIVNGEDLSDYKLVFAGSKLDATTPEAGTIYRWSKAWAPDVPNAPEGRWVPAGLFHNGVDWEPIKIQQICYLYTRGGTYPELPAYNFSFLGKSEYDKYREKIGGVFANYNDGLVGTINSSGDLARMQRIMAEAFKITMHEFTDVDDIAYHQAFIRLVLGTDNRAKNTYFQIIGNRYNIVTELDPNKTYYKLQDSEYVPIAKNETYTGTVYEKTGDNKIRLYGDDLDTIFATDNNGLQVKPYYLLEPEYNTNLTSLWGDRHSGFFYNFDLCFQEEIKAKLTNLLEYCCKDIWPDDSNSKIYQYFFSVQKAFPAIAYNHQSEIYYETSLTFRNVSTLESAASRAFRLHLESLPNSQWKDFTFNQVTQPVSLSHGRCLESEIQFMRDRVLLLSTYCNAGKKDTGINMLLEGGSQDSGNIRMDIATKYTSFIQYNYPLINGIQTLKDTSKMIYDPILDKLKQNYKNDIVYNIAVPGEMQEVAANFTITGLNASAYWTNTGLYKTVQIEKGLNSLTGFFNFPNASTLISQSSNYIISTKGENINVASTLGSIENLVVQGASIATPRLDFSECNRLKTLILGNLPRKYNNDTREEEPNFVIYESNGTSIPIYGAGPSTGFQEVILPKSNSLVKAILPNCITSINISHYKHLESLTFDEGTLLTNLTIDGQNDINLIETLINKYTSSRTKKLEITNVPAEGLNLSIATCENLALVGEVKIVGKINIINTSGDLANIDFDVKKRLVDRFGDIINGPTKFNYTESDVTSVTANDIGNIELSGYAPVILTIRGNKVDLVDATINNKTTKILDISYGIYDEHGQELTGDAVHINSRTGYITITPGVVGKYKIKTTVSCNGESYVPVVETLLTIGQYIPEVGDFMYANSTFSPIYSDDLNPIGIVYYSKLDGDKQDVRILALDKSSSNLPLGPGRYLAPNDLYLKSLQDLQSNFLEFLKKVVGDGRANSYYADSKSTDPVVLSGQISKSSPFVLVDNTYTIDCLNSVNTLSNVNEKSEQQNTYISLANDYVFGLSQKGGFGTSRIEPNLNNHPSEAGKAIFEKVKTELNATPTFYFNSTNSSYNSQVCGNFVLGLMPAHLAALYYKPTAELSGNYASQIGLGNWYIPDLRELAMLIQNRILSSFGGAINSQDYWNATLVATLEDGAFKKDAFNNVAFLKDSNNQVCSQNAAVTYGSSTRNTSGYAYAYGENQYNTIGWSSGTWAYLNIGGKDLVHSIYPCCRIEIQKK